MGALVSGIARWIYRNFISLLLIMSVLYLGVFLKAEFKEYELNASSLTTLSKTSADLNTVVEAIATSTAERITAMRSATLKLVDARIAQINIEVGQREPEVGMLKFLSPLATAQVNPEKLYAYGQNVVMLKALRLELGALTNISTELKYAGGLDAALIASQRADRLSEEATKNVEQYKKANPVRSNGFFGAILGGIGQSDLQPLIDKQTKASAEKLKANATYTRMAREVAAARANQKQPMSIKDELRAQIQPIEDALAHHQQSQKVNWIARIKQPIVEILPSALSVLASVILIPIAIKGVFYFFLAPLASKRPPIILLPKSPGAIDGLDADIRFASTKLRISSVSKTVDLLPKQELLIHPEYLQSTSIAGTKDTKWLMNYSLPWSSLLSGMFALTRIRAENPEKVVISAGHDPLTEVGLISLPEGSAFVLQPRCLIGIWSDVATPVRISRHWRIFSLHAWLTLQLRYLVFHGPATLIVKGCRGVQIERANGGRRISQAATIGFSPNLSYSTYRSDTFNAYLRGKQPLLTDAFVGDSGYFVYEETPHYGKGAGVTGRGLEGFTDAALKAFGI
jgi:hypothetical protein